MGWEDEISSGGGGAGRNTRCESVSVCVSVCMVVCVWLCVRVCVYLE